MGEVPGPGTGNIIRDSDFDDPAEWRITGNFAVQNSKMVYDAINGDQTTFFQLHAPGDGRFYWIKFTLSFVSFANPASGVQFTFGGAIKTFLNPTNGLKEFKVQTLDLPATPPRISIVNEAAGDFCKIDDFEVADMINYLTEELGIDYPDDKKTELYPGTGADFSQILASRNGKTNVGILFDVP